MREGERARKCEQERARERERERERGREGGRERSVSPATGWLVERTDTD